MLIAHEVLQNPVTAARDAHDQARLLLIFPDLNTCPELPHMALRPYAVSCPERFFDREVHRLYLDWLQLRDASQRSELRAYLASIEGQISAALLFLRQINLEDWHDRPLTEGDDYGVLCFIDKVMHPVYLRLVEGVLAPLIRPVAHFSRLDRKKGTEGLDVFNLVQELSDTPMAACVKPCNHIVRNGIGHGGISYSQRDIRYRDKKGNEDTLSVWSVVRLCDDMIDACNALASALKVFFVLSIDSAYRLPRELLVEELVEQTRSPWWTVEACIESSLGNESQLLVYARPSSHDVLKIKWACFQCAVLAEALAPGHSRYFLSLHTPTSGPGWAAFDGTVLRDQRESGTTNLQGYARALETAGFFFVPRIPLPRPFARVETLLQSIKVNWPLAVQQFWSTLNIPSIACREARMHRNGWRYVVNGSVVIPGLDNKTAAQVIRANRRWIVRAAVKAARSASSALDLAAYLPLGYARIAVFAEDFRRRRLSGFGLGPQLVCTIQLQRISRIRAPDIRGSTVESCRNWRIAWNQAWIESGGCIATEHDDRRSV